MPEAQTSRAVKLWVVSSSPNRGAKQISHSASLKLRARVAARLNDSDGFDLDQKFWSEETADDDYSHHRERPLLQASSTGFVRLKTRFVKIR
jgi:hypothetical protein